MKIKSSRNLEEGKIMIKQVVISVAVPCVLLTSSSAFAESSLISKYKRCVATERANLERPRPIQAYRDRGCTTSQTGWDGRRDTCDSNICWDAPPHNIIVSANVWDHSANGSSHRWGATQYLPSREFATQICNSVHARSNSGSKSGRGWQKLSSDVMLRRQITQAERDSIEASCEARVLGG